MQHLARGARPAQQSRRLTRRVVFIDRFHDRRALGPRELLAWANGEPVDKLRAAITDEAGRAFGVDECF